MSGNTVTVASPGNMTGSVRQAVNALQIQGTDSAAGQTLTYTAGGLPIGLSISSSGLITGTPSTARTFNVAVTATDPTGASGSIRSVSRVRFRQHRAHVCKFHDQSDSFVPTLADLVGV